MGIEAIILNALLRREQNILGENNKKSRFRRFFNPDIVKNWPDLESEREIVIATILVATISEELVNIQLNIVSTL